MTRYAAILDLAPRSVLIAALALASGCAGDDAATSGDTVTTASASGTTSGATATEGSTGSSSGSTSAGETDATSTSTTTGEASTSTGATTDDTTTAGGDGPPDYPAPEGGVCPDGATLVTVGSGSLCAPFCAGEGALCPSEGLDSASSACVPFLDSNSGSGDDCSQGQECPDGEGCQAGSYQAVLFWSCLIDCGPANECPAPMSCTDQSRCAYPL